MLDLKNVIWKNRHSGEEVKLIEIKEEEVSYIDLDTSMTQEMSIGNFCTNFKAVGETR